MLGVKRIGFIGIIVSKSGTSNSNSVIYGFWKSPGDKALTSIALEPVLILKQLLKT